MKNIKICSLYSGSRGNSAFIKIGDTAFLIDAGRNARSLCGALSAIGERIENVSALFVTHEHSDHISALELLSKKNEFPIYMTVQSAQKIEENSPIRRTLVERDIIFCEEINGIKICSFQTSHDSLMSVGYRIEFSDDDGDHAIGYATDTGYISDDVRAGLMGCEAVVLECNHDVEMLMTGPYSRYLKNRVASNRGHLSNRDCADFALELVQSGTRAIMLAHLSQENNDPDIALDEVRSATSGYNVNIAVASQYVPVELIIPEKK